MNALTKPVLIVVAIWVGTYLYGVLLFSFAELSTDMFNVFTWDQSIRFIYFFWCSSVSATALWIRQGILYA